MLRQILTSLALILLLAGCGGAETPEVSTPPPVPTSPPEATVEQEQEEVTEEPEGEVTEEATEVGELESYPPPAAPTLTAVYPEPEAVVESPEAYPAPEECEVDVEGGFAPLLESQPEVAQQVGCPVAAAEESWAAWQPFQNDNEMFWIESLDSIFALYGGQWHVYEDTFVEGDPEIPPEAPAPSEPDLIQPIRGFGQVWVDIVEEMGFATAEEGGYFTTYQPFQNGWILTSPDGRVVVLVGEPTSGSGPYMTWRQGPEGWVSE